MSNIRRRAAIDRNELTAKDIALLGASLLGVITMAILLPGEW